MPGRADRAPNVRERGGTKRKVRPTRADILICETDESASREAAERFVCDSVRAVAQRGRFFVAIPGGSSPRGMFGLLAGGELGTAVPWTFTHVFFTDERCVPPDSPRSNYRLARDLLLSHVGVPEPNVHRFLTELPADEAAAAYEEEMRRVMGDTPKLDLAVLGMGQDTHTASLFPNSPALNQNTRLAAPNPVGGAIGDRLTLTLPALCAARSVIVLAIGAEKAGAVRQALQGDVDPSAHPVQAVRPTDGKLLWLLTSASAAEL